MRVTANKICEAILKETGYSVRIQKVANDYFYFYSEDEQTDLMLSSIPSTAIYSNRLGHQTIEEWVQDFKKLIEGR